MFGNLSKAVFVFTVGTPFFGVSHVLFSFLAGFDLFTQSSLLD